MDTSKMSLAELQAYAAKLAADNEALKAAKPQPKITLKVGASGGLSVYGMGRFPVTLYKSQWLKLLSLDKEIKAFIQANDSALSEKSLKPKV